MSAMNWSRQVSKVNRRTKCERKVGQLRLKRSIRRNRNKPRKDRKRIFGESK